MADEWAKEILVSHIAARLVQKMLLDREGKGEGDETFFSDLVLANFCDKYPEVLCVSMPYNSNYPEEFRPIVVDLREVIRLQIKGYTSPINPNPQLDGDGFEKLTSLRKLFSDLIHQIDSVVAANRS